MKKSRNKLAKMLERDWFLLLMLATIGIIILLFQIL